MKLIYECTPFETRLLAREYLASGMLDRVAQCYERLLFLGKSHRTEYLRLILIYTYQGKENAAQRIIERYKTIYKLI